MALTNDQITAQNFKDFYNTIKPYLNGGATGFTPIGTVIAVMGNHAPNNYLVCDGTVYNITDYAELAAYFTQEFGSSNFFGGNGTTTFAVPDLRGEFLRGTGTNSHENQSNGEDVGVHQDAALPNITGKVTDIGFGTTSGAITKISSSSYAASAGSSGSSKFGQMGIDASKSSSIYGSTNDARPTNTSVLYCIAYKNIYIGTSSGGGGSTYTAGDGIDITNDVISTDNMPSADMDEIVTPLPSTVPKKVKYSTEEQIVGEWIDGKPIYQKVITGLSLSGSWYQQYYYSLSEQAPLIANVETIINVVGFANNKSAIPINISITANSKWTYIRFVSDTIVTLILQYTKTTDQIGE